MFRVFPLLPPARLLSNVVPSLPGNRSDISSEPGTSGFTSRLHLILARSARRRQVPRIRPLKQLFKGFRTRLQPFPDRPPLPDLIFRASPHHHVRWPSRFLLEASRDLLLCSTPLFWTQLAYVMATPLQLRLLLHLGHPAPPRWLPCWPPRLHAHPCPWTPVSKGCSVRTRHGGPLKGHTRDTRAL